LLDTDRRAQVLIALGVLNLEVFEDLWSLHGSKTILKTAFPPVPAEDKYQLEAGGGGENLKWQELMKL
jgi:hypothetical protein